MPLCTDRTPRARRTARAGAAASGLARIERRSVPREQSGVPHAPCVLNGERAPNEGAGHGIPAPRRLGGGAGRQGRASRGRPARRGHRRDGGAQPRPPAARAAPRPQPRPRAPRVGDRRRLGAPRRLRALRDDHGAAGPPAAGPRPRLPHRRLPADPQSRRRRRQPRHRLPGRRRPPRAARRGRRGGGRLRAGHPAHPRRGLLHRREAQRARPRRADPRRPPPRRRRTPAVRQGRHPQRHGHRRVRLRPRPASRHPHGPHRHRLGRPDPRTRGCRRGVPGRGPRRGRHWDTGRPLASSAAAEFAALCAAACDPIDDVRSTARYRRHAVGVLARRTLAWAWEAHRARPDAFEGAA